MDQRTKDKKLWEDFKRGEKYVLSHIYCLYIDKLFRYGSKFSSDEELIKDTIQDLFFDLIRTRANLGATDNIFFYLIKAFRHRLFRSLSGTKRLKRADEEAEIPAADITYSIEDDWIRMEQLSERDEMIRKGLAELSPKQREILYYRFTCDFEYDHICEIMSMKYGSARKMVFRALKTLKEHLTDIK